MPDAGAGSDSPAAQVARARRTFDTGRTRSRGWRLGQLEGLGRLVAEGRVDLERALAQDLGKPALESFVTELSGVATEATYARRHLRRWLRERRVRVPITLQPAAGRVRREPLGVVLIVAPWNYPAYLSLMPLVGALAAGNAVVLKPSELAPATSAALARLIPRHLDPGAVRVVEGGPEVTTELLACPLDHIFYTGGGAVGRIVMAAAARQLTPVTLELGGKSPVWLDPSADLPSAAREIAWGKFLNAGQTCVAPDYLLTTAAVAEEFIPLLTAAIRRLYGADARISADYGRIVNDGHTARLIGLLDSGRIAYGGQYDRAARYLAPTVLTDVSMQDPVMAEEVFGPILPVVTVDGLDEAILAVTARAKPLAMYAFTRDQRVRRRLLAETSSGSITFNATVVQLGVPGLPFGGVGGSGMGAYHGEAGMRTFSHQRAVLTKRRGPDLLAPARAPYTALKERIARRALG